MSGECPPQYDEWDAPACDDGHPIDGYWWQGREWIPGLIRNSTWFMATPLVFRGKAVWYGQGVMAATAEARGLSLEGYVDGVSGTSCADVGLTYWIGRDMPWGVRSWEGPYLVVDCARRGDLYGVVVGREEAVEVSWRQKEAWGMNSPEWVTVSKIPPAAAEALGVIVDWPDYFRQRAEFYPHALEVQIEQRPLYRPPRLWRVDGEWYIGTLTGLRLIEERPLRQRQIEAILN